MFYLLWYIKAFLLFVFHSHLCLSWLLSDITNLSAMWETQQTWVPSWGQRIRWGGNGNPLQYSCLESPVDTGAWRSQATELETTAHTRSHFSVAVFTVVPGVEGLFLSVCPSECAHWSLFPQPGAFYVSVWPVFPPLSCSNQSVIESYCSASCVSCKSGLTTFKLLSLIHILLTLLFTSVFVRI